jgi:hypothetical protein
MLYWLWSLPLFVKLLLLPYLLIVLVALASCFVKPVVLHVGEADPHEGWETPLDILQGLVVNGLLVGGILLFILAIII